MSNRHEDDYYDSYEYTEEPGDSEYENSTSGSHESDEASTAAETAEVQSKTLSPPFVALFDAMRRALEGLPEDLVAALKALPPVGELPHPWVVWLLLSIFGHRQRQLWGLELLRSCMPDGMEPYEALEDLEPDETRPLPGYPEWEVEVEQGEPPWVDLRNRETKDSILVDMWDDGDSAVLNLQFWNGWRRYDSDTDPASKRLLELYPLPKGLVLADWRTRPLNCQVLNGDLEAVFELADNGLVEGGEYGKYGLVPEGRLPDYYLPGISLLEHEDLASEFIELWQVPEMKLWCSAIIGDWLKTHELAVESGNEDLIRVTAPRAAECRKERIRRVVEPDVGWPAHAEDLLILYNSQAVELGTYLQRGIDGDGSAQSKVARFLNLSGDPQWCEPVYQRWSRGMLSNEILPDGFPMYLLRHDYRTAEVTSILASKSGQPR